MSRLRPTSLAALVLACASASTLTAQPKSTYHVVKHFVVGKERADYLTLDPIGRRLYGIGDKVIDIDKDTIIGSIADSNAGLGYVIANDQNRGLSRRGVLFDLKTLAVTGHIDTKGDGIAYDQVTHRGFTWVGKDMWVVDMTTGKLITKTQSMGEGLESGVPDGKGKIFSAVEDSGFVLKADTKTLKVDATYKIAGCGVAQGLSLDKASRRIFLACTKEMFVVNADNGNVVAHFPVAGRADQNCFDPVAKLAFNPNRPDSTMTIVHEDGPDKFSVAGVVPTGGAARTCAVDEKTHKVYIFYYEGTTRETAQLVFAVLAP